MSINKPKNHQDGSEPITYVKIIKNFVCPDELRILNIWSLQNVIDNPHWFNDANMDPHKAKTRLTTRFINNHCIDNICIDYPKTSYDVQNRIINLFELELFRKPTSFFDGIVNGIGFEGGSICSHVDPIYFDGTQTLHCNVISQKSNTGGVTVIENVAYDVDEGDLLCYVVSKLNHEVTQTAGKTNRILWVFGFCINDEKLKEIFCS